MRPTVPELLDGIARALDVDVAGHLDDARAQRQVAAAVAMLRRLAAVVPHLTPHLLADATDIAATLTTVVEPGDPRFGDLHTGLDRTRRALAEFDPARHTLDDLQDLHQQLLELLDRAVAVDVAGSPAATELDALLERCAAREHDLGASIAGR
jgi:hypothetical protein